LATWHNTCFIRTEQTSRSALNDDSQRFPMKREQDKGVLAGKPAGRLFVFGFGLRDGEAG
jgi:hypothetical protein